MYSDANHLSDMCFENIFSRSMFSWFIFVMVTFHEQNHLILMRSNVPFFFSLSFIVLNESFNHSQVIWIFTYIFFLKFYTSDFLWLGPLLLVSLQVMFSFSQTHGLQHACCCCC